MISLFVSLAVLIVGYILYSKITQKIFAPDGRKTPATFINDGVDCVPIKTWKAFLIQLLNIAGTGPIFGALAGAVFGPIVFLWIILGSLLGGAVHDYMTGMISCRNKGVSVAELSGDYMGKPIKYVMRVFSIILLILVGTVFITSPAELLASLTPKALNKTFWLIIIIIYYILATLLPIDKIISKLYPIFGVVLIVMALGLFGELIFDAQFRTNLQEIDFVNHHPSLPVWPFMFVTVACGAISGFHATQSPMMSKCITSEAKGRPVFYGAMICEAVIALVWAAAGVAVYGAAQLSEELGASGASTVVYNMSMQMLGSVGGVLAIIGVVVCPLTSGDTAFRSARLILAEWTGLDQKNIFKRLALTLPLLAIGAVLTFIDFNIIWRYFAWANQTLAMMVLWVCSIYLVRRGKYKYGAFLTALPATFMSAVSLTYILMAKEGLRLSATISYSCGGAFAFICLSAFIWYILKKRILKKDFVREEDPVFE